MTKVYVSGPLSPRTMRDLRSVSDLDPTRPQAGYGHSLASGQTVLSSRTAPDEAGDRTETDAVSKATLMAKAKATASTSNRHVMRGLCGRWEFWDCCNFLTKVLASSSD
jgi:hypothetical protein